MTGRVAVGKCLPFRRSRPATRHLPLARVVPDDDPDGREPTARPMSLQDRNPRASSPRTVRRLLSPARLAQFLAVGALGALLDSATLVALHGALDLALLPAKVASAEAGVLVTFAANERWTFAAEGAAGAAATLRRLVTSNAVRLVGVGVLLALANLGVRYVAANVAGLGAGFVANYCFESLLTWRVHRG